VKIAVRPVSIIRTGPSVLISIRARLYDVRLQCHDAMMTMYVQSYNVMYRYKLIAIDIMYNVS